MQEGLDCNLPKWSQLVVVGDKLTPEQTAEVMIRTSSLYFISNDLEFERELYAVIDKSFDYIYFSSDEFKVNIERANRLKAETSLDLLELRYLENSRILSSWVGGSYGWLSWDGGIGCSNYNVGKWPTAEEVYKDWQQVARAFPYIHLRCQLMSGEASNQNVRPLVEYVVSGGNVEVKVPVEHLYHSRDNKLNLAMLIRSRSERGCELEQFERALAMTRKRVSKRSNKS
jgi:hypothetical protein